MIYKKFKDPWGNENTTMILCVEPCFTTEAESGTIERYIPKDPNNSDYKQYLEWLAQGNTPDPAE